MATSAMPLNWDIGSSIRRDSNAPAGKRGCLEQYASASAVARRVASAIQGGRTSVLASQIKAGEGKLDAKSVADAARLGDVLCLDVWDEVCRYLAIACVNVQHAFNPADRSGRWISRRRRSAVQSGSSGVSSPAMDAHGGRTGNRRCFPRQHRSAPSGPLTWHGRRSKTLTVTLKAVDADAVRCGRAACEVRMPRLYRFGSSACARRSFCSLKHFVVRRLVRWFEHEVALSDVVKPARP